MQLWLPIIRIEIPRQEAEDTKPLKLQHLKIDTIRNRSVAREFAATWNVVVGTGIYMRIIYYLLINIIL